MPTVQVEALQTNRRVNSSNPVTPTRLTHPDPDAVPSRTTSRSTTVKSTVEKLSPTRVRINVEVPFTELQPEFDQAYKELAKPAEHLYRELQFALRAAVGTRTLDELLENKTVIDEVVTAHVRSKLAAYGIELDGVGVKDIVVVDTPDALLVTTTANAQKVKSVVDALRISGRDDVL